MNKRNKFRVMSRMGLFLFVVTVGLLCLTGCLESRAEKEKRDEKRRARQAQLAIETEHPQKELNKLVTAPCQTQLYFTKALGTWYIHAPGSASIPVHSLYRNDYNKIIRQIELVGAGDDVTMTELLRFTGECRGALY